MFEKIKAVFDFFVANIGSVDWIDVFMHFAAGSLIVVPLVALGVHPVVAVGLIGVAGAGREGWQQYRADGIVNPAEWSFHRWMEAVAWGFGAFYGLA